MLAEMLLCVITGPDPVIRADGRVAPGHDG
jgi:hypothetical protein